MTSDKLFPRETKAVYFFKKWPSLKLVSETPTINVHLGLNSVRPGEKTDDYLNRNCNLVELQIFHQDWKSNKY